MVMSPAGLGPENYYACDGQQQSYTTDCLVIEGASHQQTRICPTVTNLWSWVPDEGFTPRQTGRLTVGLNIRVALIPLHLYSQSVSQSEGCCVSVVSCCCEKLVAEATDSLGTQRKGNIHRWKPLLSNG
jgi:hypothetical protein